MPGPCWPTGKGHASTRERDRRCAARPGLGLARRPRCAPSSVHSVPSVPDKLSSVRFHSRSSSAVPTRTPNTASDPNLRRLGAGATAAGAGVVAFGHEPACVCRLWWCWCYRVCIKVRVVGVAAGAGSRALEGGRDGGPCQQR